MGRTNETPLVVIGGTFVPGHLARLYYSHFIGMSAGPVRIESIPWLGLHHADKALDELSERFFWNIRYPKVDLIGHSQGGILALALAQRWPHFVRKVVTLGAPFRGTSLAPSWAPFAGARCMITESRWCKNLKAPATVEIHSLYTDRDTVVKPYTSSHLDGAKNVLVTTAKSSHEGAQDAIIRTRVSHTSIATSPLVLDYVENVLNNNTR